MKANRLALTVLLSAALFRLAAQQTEIDHRSVEEIRAKAEAGDAESEYQLGLRYYSGESVAKDLAEGVKWFRKAAEKGCGRAQNKFGRSYVYSEGVPGKYRRREVVSQSR